MGRKKKKSIEKTARKGIKKELSQQLANQLQDVFNQFGDESKKSTKVIARATKSLANKLTPLAKINKSVIKKTKQKEYSQETTAEMASSSPPMLRDSTARNSQSGMTKSGAAMPARARVSSPAAKAPRGLKTPMQRREVSKVAAPAVIQNHNKNQNGPAGPPPMDQS